MNENDISKRSGASSNHFHENYVDLNKKYGIPTRNRARRLLRNLKLKIKFNVGERKHNLEHKHVDMNKIDDMTEADFAGMCPHQREKIKQIRLR